ncbi:hypothetical protein M0811_11007 [Anaeramoeba ignava]|uniref:CYRIA/CYRIB Rac1 binding domain-containing protein n=1 Tax=Anaeramoeba ignava TaxID=1746090 RepID=A0A9Q0LC09_ANAIG|nr:hypothetical protein M0811_11007 [Anaeramoeba ignava]
MGQLFADPESFFETPQTEEKQKQKAKQEFERTKNLSQDEIIETVYPILEKRQIIIKDLSTYTGQNDLIRKTFAFATEENKATAFRLLIPDIQKQIEIYEYCMDISNSISIILTKLLEIKNLKKQEFEIFECYRLLAESFDFIQVFDQIKISTPQLQNDFSFFRRNLTNNIGLVQNFYNDTLGMNMSLFFANSFPMLHNVSNTIIQFKENRNEDDIFTIFYNFITHYYDQLVSKVYSNKSIVLFILRAMVIGMCLFDNIHPNGVFNDPRFDFSNNIQFIGEFKPRQISLINLLKFSTKTLKKTNTIRLFLQ